MNLKEKEMSGWYDEDCFSVEDVKNAVLTFEGYLNEYMTETETYELTSEEVKDKFREIFGDFEND